VSRRDQIKMTEDEVSAFLAHQRVVAVATNGANGWPHVMPLWYIVRAQEIWAWTYAKSQKTRNLERDPRATLQIETGEQYHELRGVMIEASVVMHRGLEIVTDTGAEILTRYGSRAVGPQFMDVVRAQAAKRVALQFVAERIASWDHRKLGGVY
jgi:nitroimidazol reductase NimA-like FMN-containing flavoprotein (pyridoxamine 5'-phosphate oxidase superfamily)